MSAAIEIQNLSVQLNKHPILTDVNMAITKGTIVGLLGPSGAGKTTLIKTIIGLQKPAAGTVRVMGKAAGTKAVKSEIGYVTQAPSVYDDLSVAENVTYFARLRGLEPAIAQSVIERVALTDCRASLVGDLSGGQRARVSLAVALLGQPEILLLDEPTVGLDPVLRQGLWNDFKALAATGTTIVISSHVMDEAVKCDSIVFLRDGKLLVAGTFKDILAHTDTATMEDAFLKLAETSL